MTVSFEDRPITLSRRVTVYRCDNPGCSSEIDGGPADMMRTQRHPSEDECFRARSWFEVVTDLRTAGPIFCSWRCIAAYAATIKYYFPTVFTYTSSRPETKLKHTCSQVPVPPDWWS